ncbi:DNA ligase 4 [Trichophyton interdigitale MR816]|uniref:DNA ligase n=1 Tax=Trichophyton interdigitale (strain MR816) TaxID=1215338 RepID=A0A059JEW4_TRIIM|nr:DNA ligase 4 [Trichophyton interdigitale H6]KDB26334.1 DNA ligase 4 [Trichophyton interdigitale MR816]
MELNTGGAARETERELDEKPRNHGQTLPFHDLFISLFNPLNDLKKKPAGPPAARRKAGPHGRNNLSPHELRRNVIERFISRWRQQVGNDFFPAFRLIVPEKDRDRAMYGLKEKAIGKLLVKVMKIDKNSEDGYNLLNWKLPGQRAATAMAGDFAGRCFEVISKRPLRTEVGDMSIADVNSRLDDLAVASKEDEQLPILAEFYRRMNPEEMMWLIRIILRQMKVGATERTFFEIWHPDAESLFNISSSLRRVCWELYLPSIRLEADEARVTLMQCFQPQLAQFQMHSFQKIIERMRLAEDDPQFWIEEKLDGERMQLHMETNNSIPGGKRFEFWSRKAKEYTYLYGNGFYDDNGSLTRHLKNAFADGVESIILDGEMITWDPEQDAPVPFGTLKTAALAEQRNPFSASGHRPLFRIFDIVYLNGKPLTRYTLRDRRRALEASVVSVHRRFEIHPYEVGKSASDIEPLLRKVVAEASEGLVLKNPNSPYRLNERNDDWMKVKPDYMTEFGESLDCIVVGGYYGSGKRGGNISSYLCGLRVDDTHAEDGANPMKCYSFCKVGGGFTAADYANIRHHTDGKWHDWNPKKPPTEYIELAGGDAQHERPDVWIKPDDSIVVCVKAAAVTPSDQFRLGLTVRFPRFKRLRMDKDWQSALSVQEFMDLKAGAEQEKKEKEFQVDNSRRKKIKRSKKKELTVAGSGEANVAYIGRKTNIFDGLSFFVMTESVKPMKKSKADLEQLIKANGGKIYQTNTAAKDTYCIADRRTVKVASLQKSGLENVIRPCWIFDCISQNEHDTGEDGVLLPLEPRHMFFTKEDQKEEISNNVDQYDDSFARNTSIAELTEILHKMDVISDISGEERLDIMSDLTVDGNQGSAHSYVEGWLFKGLTMFFAPCSHLSSIPGEPCVDGLSMRQQLARNVTIFTGATVTDQQKNDRITHVIVDPSEDRDPETGKPKSYYTLRSGFATRRAIPHFVTVQWVEECWKEKTLVDEERTYSMPAIAFSDGTLLIKST